MPQEQIYQFPEEASYKTLLHTINRARKSIKLVTYSFTNKAIADALINKAKQGVKVKVMVERHPYKARKVNNKIINLLKKHKNITVRHRHFHKGYLHQKTLIIDHQITAILTLNFTSSGLFHQRNFMYLTNNKAITKQIDRLFNIDWKTKKYNPDKHSYITVNSVNGYKRINNLLNKTDKNLDIYASGISDKRIINKLEKLAKHASIKIILPKDHSKQVIQMLCQNGINIHYFKLKNYRQHAKVIIANPESSTPSVYIGSSNLTYTSLSKNRELGIITSNKAVTKKLRADFEKDWGQNSADACA